MVVNRIRLIFSCSLIVLKAYHHGLITFSVCYLKLSECFYTGIICFIYKYWQISRSIIYKQISTEMKPPAEAKSISPTHIRIVKAILENLKNGDTNKELFERALSNFDKDPIEAIKFTRSDETCKQLFDEHVLEFNSWLESFPKAAEIAGKKEEVKNFDILDKLISLQPRIKPNNPHASYVTYLMMTLNKEKSIKFDADFINIWRDQKIELKKRKEKALIQKQEKEKLMMDSRAQKQQQSQQAQKQTSQPPPQTEVPKEKEKEKPVLSRPVSIVAPPEPTPPVQVAEKPSNDPQKQKEREQRQLKTEIQRKQLEKGREMQRIKSTNEARFKKNKEIRLANMLKYLDSRREFTFSSNKEAVAKEIVNSMERFMREKLEKILKFSKMRLRGYVGEDAGDEFRMYSSKSNFINVKHSVMLPETEIRILKVKYPSKLQSYLKLRVEQQRQQERLKNQLKQKTESEKKTDKLIQSYIIADTQDQKQIIHEYQRDDGPERKERLTITRPVIQYAIEMDPWFQDQFMMERTFYRGTS